MTILGKNPRMNLKKYLKTKVLKNQNRYQESPKFHTFLSSA
jgi:hypothetical protein